MQDLGRQAMLPVLRLGCSRQSRSGPQAAASHTHSVWQWRSQSALTPPLPLLLMVLLLLLLCALDRYATIQVSSRAVKGDKDMYDHLAELARELLKKGKVGPRGGGWIWGSGLGFSLGQTLNPTPA